jgi:hypothetical protein
MTPPSPFYLRELQRRHGGGRQEALQERGVEVARREDGAGQVGRSGRRPEGGGAPVESP